MTAKEAAELSAKARDKSQVDVTTQLSYIHGLIRDAASKGFNSLDFRVACRTFDNVIVGPLMQVLKAEGYILELARSPDGPRTLKW